MQGALTSSPRQALALALTLFAQHAGAVTLGEIEVRSALGEALDARIPLGALDGQAPDASCFTLARDGDGNTGLPILREGVLTVESASGSPVLRIRTLASVYEPAAILRIRAACPGQPGQAERQYSILLDPRPGADVATALPTIAATLSARSGDSLQSLATRVFPADRGARTQYLAALRVVNPAFASQGDNEALPDGAPVALPDLRTYARDARGASRTPQVAARRDRAPRPALARESATPKRVAEQRAASPKAVAEPKAAMAAKPAASRDAPAQREARAPLAPPAKSASTPRTTPDSAFVLKLSSAEVDLSRTRGVDDKSRARLRERQLVLDSDDQVAALLSMRNSLKQLESRVAELQLKLATMPPSLATRSAAGPAASSQPAVAKAPADPTPVPVAPGAQLSKPEPPKAAPAKVEPPKVEPPKIAPPKVEPPIVIAAKVEPPKVEPPIVIAAKVEPPKVEPPIVIAAKVEPPRVEPAKVEPLGVTAAKVEPSAVEKPAKPDAGFTDWLDEISSAWLWAVLAALVAIAALFAWRMRRGREESTAEEVIEPSIGRVETPAEPAFDHEDHLISADSRGASRPAISSDSGLSTRLSENSGELRRRYIEERFPEIANRTLAIGDPASVVKGARLFYEDGALPRAVELLQFSIEDNPREVRTWLALFEIFRLERLAGEFAELARRFHEHHGNSEYWRKVQYFGREIDPANPLYKEDAINTLETIGPRDARRLAGAAAAATSFDPIAENWLDAPMDFQNEVLANELRQALMAQSGLSEHDLMPNAMPALRNVEVFTVA